MPSRLITLTIAIILSAFILGLFVGIAIANKIPRHGETTIETEI